MKSPTRETIDFFDAVYRNQLPDSSLVIDAGWDISGPQPVVVELEQAGHISGAVLDIGCGTGENALYLAWRGHSVIGLDGSAAAIARAQAKASQRRIDVAFAQADARELSGYRGRFDTVIDSGLLHVFDNADRALYLSALRQTARPGARVHILAISDAAPPGPGPRRLTEQQLRESFANGWDIQELRRVQMRGALPGSVITLIPSWLLTARPQ
jgi:cyclopropane fatty-acyl-phospholipid synthase-like methyltransferase